MEKTTIQTRNDLLGKHVVKALESRHFEAYYCENDTEALEKVLSLIPDGSSVGWGGSMTLSEIGILDHIRANTKLNVLDRDTVKDPAERKALMKKILTCDVFLAGCNAISEDGQIVNVDGSGNRVSAIIYGPESVILVAGMNKIVKDQPAALLRARNVAAPINSQRFPNQKTPCRETGVCADCKSIDSICNTIVTFRGCRPANRIKVVLVGENHGF